MEVSIKFSGTEELYGIAPEKLRSLSYEEALKAKLLAVEDLIDYTFDKMCMYSKLMDYEQQAKFERLFLKHTKAKELVELQLKELNGN